MQLPKIPGKKRRLLPQVNTATYTKKVADLNNRATPPGILPVGYPVFLPEEDLSPYLPDPSSMDSLRAPLRQSPASALPPVLVEAPAEVEEAEKQGEARSLESRPSHTHQAKADYYESLNPDIHRPSPPRAGAPRLFENPFELTDDDSAPVEPKKLSPSHVFESTSLEDSLYLLEAKAATPMSEKRPLDTRTFVIRRSRSNEINKAASAQASPTEHVVGLESEEIPLGAEAADEAEEHDMDYDNLMAYFENLKESNAWTNSLLNPFFSVFLFVIRRKTYSSRFKTKQNAKIPKQNIIITITILLHLICQTILLFSSEEKKALITRCVQLLQPILNVKNHIIYDLCIIQNHYHTDKYPTLLKTNAKYKMILSWKTVESL